MVEIYFVLLFCCFMPLERGARGARFFAFCFYLFLVLNRPYICRKKDWAGSSLETLTPNLEISDKRVTHSLITRSSLCFHLPTTSPPSPILDPCPGLLLLASSSS